MKKFTVFFLFTIFTIVTFSQSVTTYTMANAGLSVDRVASITDINGDVWIGEGKGISKFDGTTWTNYPWNVMNAPWDWIWIHKIIEDLDGNIWACGEAGLWKFDGVDWTYFGDGTPELTAGFMFMDMVMDEEGVFWILGGNVVESWLYSLEPSSMTWTVFNHINYPELDNSVWKIDINSEGKIILASDEVGFLEFDGTTFVTHEAVTTFDFDFDENENIWSGGRWPIHGLYYYDNEFNELLKFNTLNSQIPFDWVSFMMYNHQEEYRAIWFAGEQEAFQHKGIGIYDKEKNFFLQFNESTGLVDDFVQAFYFRENEVWMGTYDYGVMKMDFNTSSFISVDTGVIWVDIQMNTTRTVPVNIINKGGGNLGYNIDLTGAQSWLNINEWSGSVDGFETVQHDFIFDASDYSAPGTYLTTFKIESNGGIIFLKAVMKVSDITGQSEMEETNFAVYPNPTIDILNIDFPSIPQSIRILSMTGQCVEIINDLSSNNTIDISHFPVGFYIIEIVSKGKTHHSRFQKQ